MRFDSPADDNVIDRQRVVGQAVTRIDGPVKVTGQARYAAEWTDQLDNVAHGYLHCATIACGTVNRVDTTAAQNAPGVLAVVTTLDHDPLPLARESAAHLFGGNRIAHYHQAVAVVVAQSFEQARAAASLIEVDYSADDGRFELADELDGAKAIADVVVEGPDAHELHLVGDFWAAFTEAAVSTDAVYTTPYQSHAMIEPHATIASWDADQLTVWTSNQMLNWAKEDLPRALSVPAENVRIHSPFIGGGFGSKLFLRSDVVLAALAAKAAQCPVRLALPRPLIFNNTVNRSATVQRIRLGADLNGQLTAIHHSSTSGNLPGGKPESAILQTKLLYAAPNREIYMRLAELDLPEANAMRAPGEAPGLMALEIAMDEMAERLEMDPVQFRIVNDTQVDPHEPGRQFSERHLVECLQTGAEAFGWSARNLNPGSLRDGKWLIGHGMAAGIRNNVQLPAAARVRLNPDGRVVVETDMTDIGTGSYTILAQTAAEMLGVDIDQVEVSLGDSSFPTSAGSGGQWGANNATAAVYAASMKLRQAVLASLDWPADGADFSHGHVTSRGRSVPLNDCARQGPLIAEDLIEYGDFHKRFQQSTFVAHFIEAAVDAYTGEIRVRRMLAVCEAGRILNPITARSQVIGAMTMGAGAALVEELAVDPHRGFFVNHDLAGYEVAVHADITEQEVIFLDHPDAFSSPMKAKGIGELGLCGVAPAIANAVYNATGVRVRDYPITLEKHLGQLPAI